MSAVRDTVNANLDDGFAEGMEYGMVTWGIPLERYPKTYNGQPLAYAALAAQKHYYALYLMGDYADPAAPKVVAFESVDSMDGDWVLTLQQGTDNKPKVLLKKAKTVHAGEQVVVGSQGVVW